MNGRKEGKSERRKEADNRKKACLKSKKADIKTAQWPQSPSFTIISLFSSHFTHLGRLAMTSGTVCVVFRFIYVFTVMAVKGESGTCIDDPSLI